MKPWSVSYYRCPVTGDPLELHAYEEAEAVLSADQRHLLENAELPITSSLIKSGILVSPEKGFYYPIINYIPVLLDFDNPVYTHFERTHQEHRSDWSRYRRPRNRPRPHELITQKSFTVEWNVLRDDELTFTYTHEEREAFIRMELDWPPGPAAPKRFLTLDVGCGFGLESLFLARVTERPVFGIDLNLSLFGAVERVISHPLVNVAVASVFAPPFAQESIDLVYSHGVLHHTYSTRKAFQSILRFRNEEARVYIWVYALEDAQRGKMKKKIGFILELLFRPGIARLPAFLQTPLVTLLAAAHYRRYRKHGLKRDRWKFKNSVHSMRDRWTPRYAHRHSFHEVMSWFIESGLDFELLDPVEYRKAFGRNLIGIGIRGRPARDDT